jgi:hypothetical protein
VPQRLPQVANDHPAVRIDAGQSGRRAGTTRRIRPSGSAPTPGTRLPADVEAQLARSFDADVSAVRVHNSPSDQAAAQGMAARAFTVGSHIFLGPGENPNDTRLIAHELTHVVQQQGHASGPQKWSLDGDSHEAGEREAQRASESVVSGEPVHVSQQVSSPRPQRLGISDALNFFASMANNIPGFAMLTFVLGFNPINMQPVARNATNLFRAIIGFLPGGNLIFQALQTHGIIDRVGGWVQEQFAKLGMAASSLRQALDRFLNSLGWSDIFDLGGVWERARRIFSEPIDRIISFVGGLASGILRFIREAILRPLARLAEGTRAYDLLRLVLGQDPITGDPYPRTAENMIGGFMRLIGQEEKWQHLQQSGAIPRAWAWFQQQVATLLGFVRELPQLFSRLWETLQISDLLDIGGAFNRVRNIFGGFVNNFVTWAGNAALQVMMFIFEVLAPGAMPVLRRAASVIRTIVSDPIRFVGNLVRAALQGFRQFASNIRTHLVNGLVGWLTGALGGAGLQLPTSWDLRGILSLVLQILGLTWQNIRQKLVRVMGETAVRALEIGFDLVVTLVRDGPAAAWQQILQHLQNLQEMVFGQIREWVISTVVTQAVTRIVSMLNPAGAVIQAIIAIYNTIMFIRERMQQIIQVAEAVFNSLAQIANGAIGAAADYVESTMARLVPVVISFLARLLGLGGISDTIRNIIARIRAPIDRALDRVVEWVAAQARRLVSGAVSAGRRLLGLPEKRFQAGGEAHRLWITQDGNRATVMFASDPGPLEAFLNSAQTSTSIPDTNRAHIPRARQLLNELNGLIAEASGLSGAAAEQKRIQALAKEEELSQVLQRLLASVPISQFDQRYHLEGLVGTYGSMPRQTGDRLTPDHQPQASILLYASRRQVMRGRRIQQVVGGGHVDGGWAINLHHYRHVAGRTYGRQPNTGPVDNAISNNRGDENAQRSGIIQALRSELNADARAIRTAVANTNVDAPVWRDVKELRGISNTDRQQLMIRIRSQVEQEENRITAQNLDSLKEPG